MSNELVRSGRRMDEALAKLREDRGGSLEYWEILQAEMRRPCPSASSPRYSAPPVPAAPPVFLEWGACAVYDRLFFTRIERQASGPYLRVACVKADEGKDYGGQADSRVLKLDQITGPIWPCPWCGENGDVYQCDCGFWVCGGRVDAWRKKFYCRKSCGRSWPIGDLATKTHVNEETRRGAQWKAPEHGRMWQAPASAADGVARLLLPLAKGRK